MELMAALHDIPGIGPLMPYIMAVIAIGAAVAPILPPPATLNGWPYSALYRLVQWCALNVGHARNATDPKGDL